METYKLDIVGQSADLKLSPTSSKDTGIFLPNELMEFLGWSTGATISFRIHKEDCIKSAVEILSHLPLYSSKSGRTVTHDSIMEEWIDYSNMIKNFFGVAVSRIYEGSPFTISETTNGRNYLYKLDQEGFNLRRFFVAGKTSLLFSKADDGEVSVRFETNFNYKFEANHSSEDSAEESIPNSLQIIYYGAPGTGKSRKAKIQTGELIEPDEEVDLPNVFRTTFHPDTDYASFVGCYKPTMKPTSKEEKTLTGKDEEIVYEYVPQVFTDAYIYAYNNPTTPTYLVIEEINRGNCAQIFGDLFQLLDRRNGQSEYKIKADKDLAKYLSEAKDKEGQDILKDKEGIEDGMLCLPTNLHILATMNTSDQSLFPMDSAFKRRWDWEYVPINYAEDIKSGTFDITIEDKTYSWVKFIEKVNERIFKLTQSEDKQMGNFFIKHSIDEREFKSKVMFYLWYEVLRDEVGNKNYFFCKKENAESKDNQFTFKDLYDDNATETLQQFMTYLGVSPK